VVPEGDIIRYRFGDREVILRPVGGDMNRITAEERMVRPR
jgi:hypothetical protein